MKIHPLSFNLSDYDLHATLIGQLPPKSLPPEYIDLVTFWRDCIQTNEILKNSCFYTEKVPAKNENDSIGDYMLRYFDSLVKQPQRQHIKIVIGVPNSSKIDRNILTTLISEARNFNATVVMQVTEANTLNPDLEMTIFGNVGLFVIGQLTSEDKTFFQDPKHRYFETYTDSVINLKPDQYCIMNRNTGLAPVIYQGVHTVNIK